MEPTTEVVITNAPPWMTPEWVAHLLKTKHKLPPRVTVDGVTREPGDKDQVLPGVRLGLPQQQG